MKKMLELLIGGKDYPTWLKILIMLPYLLWMIGTALAIGAWCFSFISGAATAADLVDILLKLF